MTPPAEKDEQPSAEANRDHADTTEPSSLRYLLVIIAFAGGIIGMLALFVVVNAFVGIAFFWVLMAAFGFGLYRLLTAEDQA